MLNRCRQKREGPMFETREAVAAPVVEVTDSHQLGCVIPAVQLTGVGLDAQADGVMSAGWRRAQVAVLRRQRAGRDVAR